MELTQHHQDLLAEISTSAREHVAAVDALWRAVAIGRAEFLTWSEIGRALNCTKQAAQERFSKPPRGRLAL